jgi:4-amino-4-deoxy-L-arabinose transferase-like glycosyltransferase
MYEFIISKIYSKPLQLLAVLYFLFRLPFLTALPIFNDEAIYLDWGQRMVAGQLPLFYPLFDGKQPLLMWIFGIFSYLFPDPLPAGRLISVITGMFCLVGIYKLGCLLFDKRSAFIASAFYIFTPLFLFYDRQALMESSIAAVGIWTVYTALLYIKSRKIKYVVYFALLFSVGLSVKTSAVLFVFPIFIIFIWALKRRNITIGQTLNSAAITAIILFLVLLPLVTQDNFSAVFTRNDRFTFVLAEYLQMPYYAWLQRSRIFTEVIFWQVTPFISILSLFGFFKLLKRKENHGTELNAVVLAGFFVSLLVAFVTVRNLQPRYLEPYLPFMLLPAGYAVSALKGSFSKLVLPVVFVYLIMFSGFTLVNPEGYLVFIKRLSIATDHDIYMGGFTSGHGFNETKKYLEDRSREGPLIVGVRLDAGNPESTVFAYWANGRNPNIKPIYFDSAIVAVPDDGETFDLPIPLYFVAREKHLGGMDALLTEEVRFYKPDKKSYIGIYSLNRP